MGWTRQARSSYREEVGQAGRAHCPKRFDCPKRFEARDAGEAHGAGGSPRGVGRHALADAAAVAYHRKEGVVRRRLRIVGASGAQRARAPSLGVGVGALLARHAGKAVAQVGEEANRTGKAGSAACLLRIGPNATARTSGAASSIGKGALGAREAAQRSLLDKGAGSARHGRVGAAEAGGTYGAGPAGGHAAGHAVACGAVGALLCGTRGKKQEEPS